MNQHERITRKHLRTRIRLAETEQERLRAAIASIANERDQLLALLREVRAELAGVRVDRATQAGRLNDVHARLRRLMDAAMSGDHQKLHDAVLYEVRNNWQRRDDA